MTDNVVFCTQCGAQSTGGAGFCQKCGARLAATAMAPQPAAPAGSYAVAAAPMAPVIPVLPESYYGGFWIRVAAYLIDGLLVGVVTVPIFLLTIFPSVASVIHQAESNQEPGPEVMAALIGSVGFFALLAFCGHWLYEALLTSSSWQGTIGKRILRLKVTDDGGNRIGFGRSTARFFAKILSGWIMYVGFIMVAFMERKRGLHDVICGTQVLRY
jgi:uncharacterized RDD family membrane protein YckC